jgi:CHAD domain-containing protein
MAKKPKKTKKTAPVHPIQTVNQAFATILKHNFELLLRWEDTARSWQDTEGVHQVRVALRRMRSAFTAFRPAVPRAATEHWSKETRGLFNRLGLARDIDVFIEESLGAVRGKLFLDGEEHLKRLAEARRAGAYDEVRCMLDSQEYARFKRDFRQWLDTEAWQNASYPAHARKRLQSNVVTFARQVINERMHKFLKAGNHVDQTSALEMHRLRIKCKKLRYSAEFFAPLFDSKHEFVGHLKALQDLLGAMHDVAVLPDLLSELVGGAQDADALMYAGALIGWRAHEYHELQQTFPARWKKLSEVQQVEWQEAAAVA